MLNEEKVRKHEDRLQSYGLLNVNRSPNMRHNGDKTLERSIEFNTDPLPIAQGSPTMQMNGNMPSRQEMTGGASSQLYQSQRRYGSIDPGRPYADITNDSLKVPGAGASGPSH
jgi:hypothetical protein|mmetsp:Transcript_39685/g.52004  ORF Transcript_39685/g.52004 Transcript_39685/m.52004 type:complete len:113 (+) Transcript_39685:1294-1632(+)